MIIKHYNTGPIGVNTYLVYDETKKGFIVDPGGFSKELAEHVDSEAIEVQYIILTHGHGDHIGGVEESKKHFSGSKIVALKEEQELLEDPKKNASLEIFFRAVTVDADILVSEGDSLNVGNIQLDFIHTPGHTKGGMCIITEGAVFSGDTLFRGSIGRTDFYGGSFDEICDSIRSKLYALPDETVVYPGHMQETTIGFEKRYNPFVKDQNQ